MRRRTWIYFTAAGFSLLGIIYGQMPFREYPAIEYYNFPLPPTWQEKTEWQFGRLIYGGVDPHRGLMPLNYARWTMDYPRSDRHLSAAVRRLTRIHARSVEQPISLDDGDDVYNWPFLYGVEVGYWDLTDEQCKKLRDFLLRGGFFMCDDFHGTREWANFMRSMSRVFPDRPVVEIDNKDAIFHTIYDLDDRYQVPGAQFLESGQIWEHDGFEPRWRGIYDDKGRIMVAMCHNMDLGDSWEHADNPLYPEKFSAMGLRIGINYIVYDMTH
jgi:Domain of unknown function (DUF4159)